MWPSCGGPPVANARVGVEGSGDFGSETPTRPDGRFFLPTTTGSDRTLFVGPGVYGLEELTVPGLAVTGDLELDYPLPVDCEGEECDDGSSLDGDGYSACCSVEFVGERCTPGFWRQEQHFDSWMGYSSGQSLDTVFGVDAPGDDTLLDAARSNGGGERALGRPLRSARPGARSTGHSIVSVRDSPLSAHSVTVAAGCPQITNP